MGPRVASVVEKVVVFPGAAWITRVARTTVTARTSIAMVGLPAALDDDTVQLAVSGPARAADVRVTLEITGAAADSGPALDDGELHERRRAVAGAQAELAHLRRQLDGLSAFGAQSRGERDEAAPAWGDALAARIALIELRAATEPRLRAAVAAAERAVEDARQALAAAELRRAQASSAQLPPGSVRKVLVVTIEPATSGQAADPAGGDVEVRASYLVPGASWAPSYVVRLGDERALRLELRASIAQATGEDWAGVAVEVSTASPQRWVELPELPSLRLGRAQPTPARAGWRPPPPDIEALFGDWDRAFGGRRGAAMRAQVAATTITETPADEIDADTRPYEREELERSAGPFMPPPQGAPMPKSAPMPTMVMAAPAAYDSLRMGAPKRGSVVGAVVGGVAGGLGAIVGGVAAGGAAVARGAARQVKGRRADEGGARKAYAPDHGADEDVGEEGGELTVEVELLQYARLHMRGPHRRGRGKLGRVERAAAWGGDARAAQAVRADTDRALAAAAPMPPAGFAIAASGAYDYAFAAEARVDVPSDGTWHNVALLARTGTVDVRHVVVPAVAPEVYRVARFENPLDAPLLAGPVDVYDRGELAVTATLDETPPGAAVELGLGVDAAVKCARNARFREEAAGMLRGALKLVHEVTVEVENLGARTVQLEIRERLPRPAPDEEDVEVHLDRVAPAWEAWRPDGSTLEGGHRWTLELAAATKRALHLDYHVRIAGKHELIGGNRREP